jgi:tripartite-type tricarboxylate transporter receptor subunit TctC
VKGDKVRLIATTAAARTRLFPEVPTVQESGVKGFDVETWWGIVGPANLPADVVRTLNKAINDAAASPEMKKRFESEGADPFSGAPADLARTLHDELEGWRRVVREGGLKID